MSTIYITKYALTEGILERELVKKEGGMVVVKCDGWMNGKGYFHGNDWWDTKSEAVTRANEMRRKKIVSLKKTIEKLEHLSFK